MKIKAFLRILGFLLTITVATLSLTVLKGCDDGSAVSREYRQGFEKTYQRFLEEQQLLSSDYPDELLALLQRNPETEDFVLNYPLLKDAPLKIDISDCKDSATVPYFKQWDKRWGYKMYGSNVMGLTGCGPTCLSMVAVYLLKDDKYDPSFVADMSTKNGYYVEGSGSSWKLISEGSAKIGLYSEELPLHKSTIIKHLSLGHPIICVMGPGDFTTTGHFIVITEHTEKGFKLHDPNSIANTDKPWSYETLAPQIKNLWAIAK